MDREDGETTVVVYLNSLTAKPTCFEIDSIQTNTVENLKDGTIEVRDYYSTGEFELNSNLFFRYLMNSKNFRQKSTNLVPNSSKAF